MPTTSKLILALAALLGDDGLEHDELGLPDDLDEPGLGERQ